MAPLPLETRAQLVARLRAAGPTIAATPLRFGGHHYSHVVLVEGGRWRVRALVLDRAKADAYRARHGMFMPEHAEMLSEPGPDVWFEADSLEGLIAALEAAPWPPWQHPRPR